MTVIERLEQGQFCWVELSSTDQSAARDFYVGLFGWDVREDEIPGGVYFTFERDGKSVGACYQQMENEQGMPPRWNTHIAVDDVDATTQEAEGLGGKTIAEPFDVMEFGRMAVITDPTGAFISLWQDAGKTGPRLINEPGSRVWNELVTPDPDGAAAFYTQLLGYTAQTQEMPNGPYTILSLGDAQWAGVLKPQEEWGMPPTWIVYFGVEDAETAIAKTKELGGSVLVPPIQVPGVGTFAWINDPQGATFGIIQSER